MKSMYEVGIIAIKTERTQIHFLSDVLIAVASLDLKVPKDGHKTRYASRRTTFRIIGSLRYGDYGLRLRINMLLRMIKTT